MIVSFNKTTNEIEICEKTDFKSHVILERQHLEKWIEKNPDLLGEELLIITNEYDKFDKTKERLDLLALDKEGNVVVIELKRDDNRRRVGVDDDRLAVLDGGVFFRLGNTGQSQQKR